jgi:hypothetical protein
VELARSEFPLTVDGNSGFGESGFPACLGDVSGRAPARG